LCTVCFQFYSILYLHPIDHYNDKGHILTVYVNRAFVERLNVEHIISMSTSSSSSGRRSSIGNNDNSEVVVHCKNSTNISSRGRCRCQ